MQKSVAFLYINNKLSEIEIRKTNQSKSIKYLGINLTKEVKELYSSNCKILMKEIEDDKTNEKIYHTHGLEELLLLKWPYSPRQIYRFNAIPIKIPMAFFIELEQIIIKFVGNTKDPKQPKQS